MHAKSPGTLKAEWSISGTYVSIPITYCCVTHYCRTATILLYLTILWVRNSGSSSVSMLWLALLSDIQLMSVLIWRVEDSSHIQSLGGLSRAPLPLHVGSGLCHMVSPSECLDILCVACKRRWMLPVSYGLDHEMGLALLSMYSIGQSSHRTHPESRGWDRELTSWQEACQIFGTIFNLSQSILFSTVKI